MVTTGPSQSDPTSLTTAALAREMVTFREVLEAKLDSIDARFTGMDKALERAEKYPTAIDSANKSLKELYDEKFKGIADVLEEREKRAISSAIDIKTAVDTAFKSQTESAAKTERNFVDQIGQTANLLTTKTQSLDTQLNDAKTRLTAIESRTSVSKEVTGDNRALLFSIVAAAASAAGLIFGIIALVRP